MGVQGVTVPAEVFWFSQEDVCRHALAAYAIAREQIQPPPGEKWWDNNGPWCTGTDFAAFFLQAMVVRLHEQGQAAGQPFHALLSCGDHAFNGV